ncbi:MAG: helix-turn-helix domain-containing protein [Candidatus Dormibacteria bacterium]
MGQTEEGEEMPTGAMRQLAALPPMISIEDTCRLLGLSRSAGYRAVTAGQIPTVKIGRRLYVPTPRLLALLGAITVDGAGRAKVGAAGGR